MVSDQLTTKRLREPCWGGKGELCGVTTVMTTFMHQGHNRSTLQTLHRTTDPGALPLRLLRQVPGLPEWKSHDVIMNWPEW